MNTNQLNQVLKEYPIKPIIEVKEINQGNTSNAKLIVTSDGKYIIRKLKDIKQAMTEFVITQALIRNNISPEILLNNDHQPFVKVMDDVYNLQVFIEHHHIRNKEMDYFNLGKTISNFHLKIQNIKDIIEQDDRFNLHDMWKQLKQNSEFINLDAYEQLETMVNQCFNYKHRSNCYIHGDLGMWNLLFNENNIFIIDYGEIRKGNNHFDISAVISSSLDWNQDDNQIIHSLIDFHQGYLSNFKDFNWTILKENFALWFTRGIMGLFLHNGINQHTRNYMKIIIERGNRLDNIFVNYFL